MLTAKPNSSLVPGNHFHEKGNPDAENCLAVEDPELWSLSIFLSMSYRLSIMTEAASVAVASVADMQIYSLVTSDGDASIRSMPITPVRTKTQVHPFSQR